MAKIADQAMTIRRSPLAVRPNNPEPPVRLLRQRKGLGIDLRVEGELVVNLGDVVGAVTDDVLERQQGPGVNPKRGLAGTFPFAPHFVADYPGVAAADLRRRTCLEVPGIDPLHAGGYFIAEAVCDRNTLGSVVNARAG